MSVDLTTSYLGMELAHPVVPSASPLTGDIDHIHALVDAGAPALVLPSLFEEQIEHDAMAVHFSLELGADGFGETPEGFFPQLDDYNTGPEDYLDLIRRASEVFNHVVVAVLRNESKTALFTVEERMEMLSEATKDLENVSIDSFSGLLVDYARTRDARLILRGIRAISDYEYELQMALMNRHLEAELETLFMPAAEQYSYLSSRLVKEVNRLGGDISKLVPPNVARRLTEKAS